MENNFESIEKEVDRLISECPNEIASQFNIDIEMEVILAVIGQLVELIGDNKDEVKEALKNMFILGCYHGNKDAKVKRVIKSFDY